MAPATSPASPYGPDSLALIGAIAGWLAGRIVKGGRFGLVVDIIVGIIVAVIGGFLAGIVGISSQGIVGSIILAVIGAVVLLVVLRIIKRA